MVQALKLNRYNLTIDSVCDERVILEKNKCDKYDYLISACSGIAAGLIDAFFVGSPLETVLGGNTDKLVDNTVMKFAKAMGWNPKEKNLKNVGSAIGFLERKYRVNYDQAMGKDVGNMFNMTPKNHHIMSLGHAPDVVGLFFSIIDQFQSSSHFIADSGLISIKLVGEEALLQGGSFHAKLFSGFVNWLGHIMSDIAGSSGARGVGKVGRGSGLSIPFMELFQFCQFGSFNYNGEQLNFAKIAIKVFESGYDFRFGMTMAIPVILNDLFIKIFWVIKRKFYKGVQWSDCFPTSKHSDLRIMLLIGNACLCLVDGLDAVIRSGGNIVAFILRFNMIAWVRLIMLIFRELRIRYGNIVLKLMKDFIKELPSVGEYEVIQQFYERLNNLDISLNQEYKLFVKDLEEEYGKILDIVEVLNDSSLADEDKSQHSVQLSKSCKVEKEKIIKDFNDLDELFLN